MSHLCRRFMIRVLLNSFWVLFERGKRQVAIDFIFTLSGWKTDKKCVYRARSLVWDTVTRFRKGFFRLVHHQVGSGDSRFNGVFMSPTECAVLDIFWKKPKLVGYRVRSCLRKDDTAVDFTFLYSPTEVWRQSRILVLAVGWRKGPVRCHTVHRRAAVRIDPSSAAENKLVCRPCV